MALWNDLNTMWERIKSLLAWEDLKKAEHASARGQGFWPADSISSDLKNAYSQFLALSLQLHCRLGDPNCLISKERKITIQKQLRNMENEIRQRHLPERFINL